MLLLNACLRLSDNALTDRAPMRCYRLRADREMQGRIEELADKCTEGILTSEEREEYEALIRVGNFVAILQAESSLPDVLR
jgi:hypothetical protein